MPDKRTIDELSIEELERVLAIRRREARQTQLQRMKQSGRVIDSAVKEADPMPWESTPEANAPALQKRKSVPEFEDAVDSKEFKRRSTAGRIWRSFLDRSLLLVEVGAVIGLVFLGFALFNGLNLLQEETAAAQLAAAEMLRAGIPTPTPQPQLMLANVVLPTGHTPPQNGISNFNFEEIPRNLRGELASQVYLPLDVARPPATDDTPLQIIIPDLNIDNPIVQGIDWNALQSGVGMLPNGATPRDDDDNVVLAAHNDIYGQIFRYLDRLEPGMQMQIRTRAGTYTYIVRETLIVEPDDVYVMDSQGRPMITLISCYPYQVNTQRIVVFADRVDI